MECQSETKMKEYLNSSFIIRHSSFDIAAQLVTRNALALQINRFWAPETVRKA